MKRYDRYDFERFFSAASKYISKPNLAARFAALSAREKADVVGLWKLTGASIGVCIQQVAFFGNNADRERRFFLHREREPRRFNIES